MTDAEPAQLVRDVLAVADGGLGEPGPEPRGGGVDPDLAPGLGVDEREVADVGQLVLAGIADLHDEHRVALGDGAQLREPVDGPAEVGDEDDLATRRRAAGDEAQCRLGRARAVGERLVAGAARAPSVSASRSVASSAARPVRGSVRTSLRPPNVITPRRLPRCAERCAIAMETPSATSALRRSAVPNCMEGEESRRSQVVSARSGTWTRTWGWFIRAVTFQSIRRTSSPASYGRTCASSVPPPRSRAR